MCGNLVSSIKSLFFLTKGMHFFFFFCPTVWFHKKKEKKVEYMTYFNCCRTSGKFLYKNLLNLVTKTKHHVTLPHNFMSKKNHYSIVHIFFNT